MLILSAIGLMLMTYVIRQPFVADVTANWIEQSMEVIVRALRAYSAAQKASQKAFAQAWTDRWNLPAARSHQQLFYASLASNLFPEEPI